MSQMFWLSFPSFHSAVPSGCTSDRLYSASSLARQQYRSRCAALLFAAKKCYGMGAPSKCKPCILINQICYSGVWEKGTWVLAGVNGSLTPLTWCVHAKSVSCSSLINNAFNTTFQLRHRCLYSATSEILSFGPFYNTQKRVVQTISKAFDLIFSLSSGREAVKHKESGWDQAGSMKQWQHLWYMLS